MALTSRLVLWSNFQVEMDPAEEAAAMDQGEHSEGPNSGALSTEHRRPDLRSA